jgi:proton-translocating NADH-quinone oxidoreductase chain L
MEHAMSPVSIAWAIPALPLFGVVLLLAVIRPLDLAQRRRLAAAGSRGQPAGETPGPHTGHGDRTAGVGQPGQPAGPGGPVGGHDVDTLAGAHGAGGALEVDHLRSAHAHDDHGGEHGHPATPSVASTGGWIAFLLMLVTFALSIAILFQFIGDKALQANGYDLPIYNWFTLGNLSYAINFRVDPLTTIMLVVVTTVSMLVMLYSMGYMQGDPGYTRFYTELSIFTFSMLILVLAANFLVIFIGWELVGLSSYLLIGFWYERPDPPPAALKAFVTTRFGDFGFLIGILLLFTATGTFTFASLNSPTGPLAHVNQFYITAAMILIFCGAVGKSAQFPLHVWLPDAMEGPTPVSALIHAATMVAAGVYLVARLFPIYAHFAGPQSLLVVGYVGGFTALFAATIALVQNDIKRVLAYSTVSQLGYMFVGLAVADTNSVGIFHLFTHAFFKALLFLGSGSVIHAVANQDMRKMGGLAKRMPITAGTFLVATLAISGIPGFSGFFSKDDIIGHAFTAAPTIWGGYTLYIFTLSAAVLTAFYMFRLYFMTFGGPGSSVLGLWGGDAQYRGDQPAHESPWTMSLPLLILAVPAALAGWLAFAGFGTYLNGGKAVPFDNPFTNGMTYLGVGAAAIGIVLAWVMYGRQGNAAAWYRRVPGGVFAYNVLAHKYYLDELYLWLIKWIVLGIAQLAVLFDLRVIDGFLHGTRDFVLGLGNVTSHAETGRLQNYAAVYFAGALVLVIALFVSAAYLVAR